MESFPRSPDCQQPEEGQTAVAGNRAQAKRMDRGELAEPVEGVSVAVCECGAVGAVAVSRQRQELAPKS